MDAILLSMATEAGYLSVALAWTAGGLGWLGWAAFTWKTEETR